MSAEPRRSPPVPQPVTVTRPDGTETTEYVLNLSAGGLCLHVRRPLATGTRVGIALELPDGGARIRAPAWVVWCMREEERAAESRFWEVGLRLEDLVEADRERLGGYVRQPFEDPRGDASA